MAISGSLSASMEDYLEAIFHIVEKKQAAKPRDISKRLGIGSSSVTGALQGLAGKGLINYQPYDVITLTDDGKVAAKRVVRRHEALRDFLVEVLVIPYDEADDVACRMEHAVRGKVLERLIEFVEFVEVCPRGGSKWIKGFQHYCEHGRDYGHCERCLTLCLEEVKQKAEEGGNKKMIVQLNELETGRKAKIVKVAGKGETNKRIVDMGVTRGTLIEVERVAPLGDPIEIKVKGYHLSLRKEEAGNITVEPQ